MTFLASFGRLARGRQALERSVRQRPLYFQKDRKRSASPQASLPGRGKPSPGWMASACEVNNPWNCRGGPPWLPAIASDDRPIDAMTVTGSIIMQGTRKTTKMRVKIFILSGRADPMVLGKP